jgi:hypothetical protein
MRALTGTRFALSEIWARKMAFNPSVWHSADAIRGFDIGAMNGGIGHAEGFVVDDEAWEIRYVDVATRNWLPGKKVPVAPD